MKTTSTSIALAALLTGISFATAGGSTINLLSATPAGSWQEREELTTDARGKRSLTVVKIKHLGEEERNGKGHSWIETESQSFKLKKNGKRKANGERAVMKVLVPRSVLEGDMVNLMSNLGQLGEEIIMQSGDSQPMRISDAGGLMQGAAKAANLQISYDYQKTGSDELSMPAGTFNCTTYEGSGHTTMNMVFKTLEVHSKATTWVSDQVPFGIVQSRSQSTVDGQEQSSETKLTAFGTSGATSSITGEPVEMPSIGDIFGG